MTQARQFEKFRADRRAVRAEYEAVGDRVAVYLSDGVIVSIPREYLQGLHGATRAQLSDINVVGRGTGLHWPELDADHYVPGLLNQVFGTKRWMSELGRLGGLSRSEAKARASRANGAKGGRPRKAVASAGKKRKTA
jgi:hypothetical protein